MRQILESHGIDTVSSAHDWALANGLQPSIIVQIVRSRPGSNISGFRTHNDFDLCDRIFVALGVSPWVWYEAPMRQLYYPDEDYADTRGELYEAGPTEEFLTVCETLLVAA